MATSTGCDSMSWYQNTQNGLAIFQCAEFNTDRIIQAVSTAALGNMALHTGDDREEVVERRNAFLAACQLPLERLVTALQIHGTEVKAVDLQHAGAGAVSLGDVIPDTDGLVTNADGLILAILTADCYPIFIYDPVTPAIGLAHAGWRGTIGGIAGKTLATMSTHYGTRPEDCLVTFGPAICGHCFHVGPEVAAQFIGYAGAIQENQSGTRIDLAEVNRLMLTEAGVDSNRIIKSGYCTVCQADRFFSYRRHQGTIGRFMSIIALKSKF